MTDINIGALAIGQRSNQHARAISHLLPNVVLLSSARIDLYVTYKKSKAFIQNLKFLYFKFIFFYHLSKNRGNCPILTKDSITSVDLTALLSELTHHHYTCNKCVEYQGPWSSHPFAILGHTLLTMSVSRSEHTLENVQRRSTGLLY